MSGSTEKDGVFSLWNGHRPQKFLPFLARWTYSEITEMISIAILTRSTCDLSI